MTDPKIPALERSRLEPNRYEYLSVEDSRLLDKAAGYELTQEDANIAIVRLLIEKASRSRQQHAQERY